MSTGLDASELAPLPDDVAQPAAEPQEPQAEAVQTLEAQPADDEPDAIEIHPGEKFVPLSAVQALRKDNKELKAQAAKVPQLEQRLQQIEPLVPFAEFVKNNPHLLQPQTAQPAPVPVPLDADPALVNYAKRFDLYTAEGKPDVERAKAIIDDHKKMAEEAAQAAVAPLQQQTNEQRAIANLNEILALKDGEGNAINADFITQAVASLVPPAKTPQEAQKNQQELIKMLADKGVASVVANVALGLQARAPKQPKGAAQPPVPGAPLHVETAGGKAPQYTINASGKRMAEIAKIDPKKYEETARAFNPNGPNTFE